MAETGVSSCRRFPQGSWSALEELIRAYSDALVRFAYGYVQDSAAAEDVVEDVFAVMFVRGKRFADEQAMRSYLYKAVRNRAVDYLRRHRNHVPLEDVENILYAGDTEEAMHRKLRNEKLYLCLQKLPAQYREVLQLSYFDGFSLKESARIMGKTMKQIYNLHARAKDALRVLLEKEGITDEDI